MQVGINSVTNVLSVIKRINASTTIDDIFQELSRFAEGYGFKTTSILPLMSPALRKINIWDVARSNFPEEFQQRWVENHYIFHDPVPRFAMKSRSAFEWKTAYAHASRFGQKILDEARDFSLQDGLAVPVMYQNYPTGMISMGFDVLDLSPTEIAEVELVCIHSYTKLLKVCNIDCDISREELTPREVDVLYYAAAGKTNWEIASIYNISEYSVKDHMKNISRKLDASNRAHAVTLGILSGQIIP